MWALLHGLAARVVGRNNWGHAHNAIGCCQKQTARMWFSFVHMGRDFGCSVCVAGRTCGFVGLVGSAASGVWTYYCADVSRICTHVQRAPMAVCQSVLALNHGQGARRQRKPSLAVLFPEGLRVCVRVLCQHKAMHGLGVG